MDGLKMKYFVLKPKGDDPHAIASRDAMRAYATAIKIENSILAKELNDWATAEAFGTSHEKEQRYLDRT
jgi:hypothetical protein